MTTYKLKNKGKLLNKKTTMQIIYILYLERNKHGLTTKQIYKRGKELFGNDFPKNYTTVLRYLNTMLEYGKVGKYKKYWSLKDEKIAMGKVLAKLDIESIQKCLEYENQFYGSITLENMTIYRVSQYVREFFEDDFIEIVENMKEIYKKLEELNSFAIVEKILRSKYEKDYLVYEKYYVGKKIIENLKFNRNLINILRFTIIVFTVRKLQKELIGHQKVIETIENLKKGKIPEIRLGGIDFDLSQIGKYRMNSPYASKKFFFLFAITKINERLPPLLIEKNNTVRIHSSYLVPMVYKKRTEGEIINGLKNVKFTSEIYQMLYGDTKDIIEYMVPYVYYKSFVFPIIVINPIKEKKFKESLFTMHQLLMD